MGMLDNKTAVITGASQGIGLATARRFVDEGATVFITGRNADRLHQTAAALGQNAVAVPGDAYDLDDLDSLFTTISAAGRGLDIVMTNAAVRATAPLADVTPGDFDTLFGANVRAVFFTVQKALPLLHDDASIILVGSAAAHRGQADTSLYASSNATLHSFARIWTAELKDRRIRVNVLTPGSVDTGSLERRATSTATALAARQAIITATPLGRTQSRSSPHVRCRAKLLRSPPGHRRYRRTKPLPVAPGLHEIRYQARSALPALPALPGPKSTTTA
jgi:NAD(P)-dependent dehydrogenase (short-subunit alcohol dehydrogenase family)